MKLHWQIAIALALAVVVGALAAPDSRIIEVCGFVGGLFINGLKMVVVPLIAASIIHSLLSIPDSSTLTRMGGRLAAYYVITGLMAILTGLAIINLVQPGIIDGAPAKDLLGLTSSTAKVDSQISNASLSDITLVISRMVPANPLKAAVETDLLGVVAFCLLFGFFATRLPSALAQTQREFWGGVRETMMMITGLVMYFAPIGVFALVAKAFASTGLEAIRPLALFFFCVLGALLFHLLINMSLVLAFVARVSPLRMLKVMTPALLTGFSTSTSAGTMPVTLSCLKRGGVSDRVTSFSLPLGATVNLDGSALYECAVAMFLAQAYGLDLNFATQFLIVFMALVTALGVTGIPSASLVAIAVILGTIGLPLEGIGVILAVDRVLDMCRTAVNVYGDACGAVVIARLEGEKDILKAPV